MSVRKYELMVILDPARTEDEQKQTLDDIDELLKKYGATPQDRDVWGKRRLTYLVKGRRDGYYAVVTFDVETTSEALLELDRFCKFREEVIRHLTTAAVTGKSKGNPALADQAIARNTQGSPSQRGTLAPPRGTMAVAQGIPTPGASGAPGEEAGGPSAAPTETPSPKPDESATEESKPGEATPGEESKPETTAAPAPEEAPSAESSESSSENKEE